MPQIPALNCSSQIHFLLALSQGTYLAVVGRKLCSRGMLGVWLRCGWDVVQACLLGHSIRVNLLTEAFVFMAKYGTWNAFLRSSVEEDFRRRARVTEMAFSPLLFCCVSIHHLVCRSPWSCVQRVFDGLFLR